jgi:CRISPR-associated protein Csm2
MKKSFPDSNRTQDRSRHGDSGGRYSDAPPLVVQTDLEQIILFGNAEKMVASAMKVGKAGVDKPKEKRLSTSQIRAIFGEVRMLEGQMSIPDQKEKAFHRLYLLKPKLAYRARKEKSEGVDDLVKVLDPAIDLVFKEEAKREERFTHFIEFFEAILAYHKAFGGN